MNIEKKAEAKAKAKAKDRFKVEKIFFTRSHVLTFSLSNVFTLSQ